MVGLSVQLLSVSGAPVLTIPPRRPNDARVVKMLDGHRIAAPQICRTVAAPESCASS
jgi:hypothetical protein